MTINIRGQEFELMRLNKGEKLPNTLAHCNNCGKDRAKVFAKIIAHSKPSYAINCPVCGNTYYMYIHRFRDFYIGSTTKNGVEMKPTYGSSKISADNYRRFKQKQANHPSKQLVFGMQAIYKCSEEEARQKIKEHYKKEQEELSKAVRNTPSTSERQAKRDEEEIQSKSLSRKELIDKGILVYDKKNRCLINTETGEVIKL